MCGICGAIDFGGSTDTAALVHRMTPAMIHRGPDDAGYLTGTRLSVGMRRLSIIDLEGGHQPMFNEDGSVGVVQNGEIYNFLALKDTLESLGHTFRTRSDSEVIAHAYEEWGAECVQHLQGMFAIAIYDQRESAGREAGVEGRGPKLFLARDRLGIKPLYYYVGPQREGPNANGNGSRETSGSSIAGGNVFLFASEVRTLLASGAVPRKLSRSALESYLLFGSVSEPMTLVEGIFSLPPGHSLTIDLGSKTLRLDPVAYWNIAEAAHRNGSSSQKDKPAATKRVRELLEESVRLHLIADVPVGVFLSGGIDSTAVAALASHQSSDVHTFTVAFAEQKFNEAEIARRTARQLGTRHDELLLTGSDMLARIHPAVGDLDQPSIDGINTWFVSWAAREAGLKVALSGLGGDEIFGGYKSTFRWTPRYQRLAAAGVHVPHGVRSAMASALTGAGQVVARSDAANKLAALWNDSTALPDPYFFARALFTPSQAAKLIRDGEGNDQHESRWWKWLATGAREAKQLDSFAAVTCLEARSYLVNTLLRDTDSMSMAHSLEVRVPFLHHPLVEFVAQLPEGMKNGKGMPKELLVTALGDLLPSEVVQQRKRGFTFPWSAWLRGPLKEGIERGLKDLAPALRPLLDEKSVYAVWESYLNGKTSWSRPWSLYVLNEWVKQNLDPSSDVPLPLS
jgi:asparagine synthase (glutamine-hydrolysing)